MVDGRRSHALAAPGSAPRYVSPSGPALPHVRGNGTDVAAHASLHPVQACFDHKFYINSGYDLAFIWDQPDPPGLAWDQFLSMGLYEGRPYRFTC